MQRWGMTLIALQRSEAPLCLRYAILSRRLTTCHFRRMQEYFPGSVAGIDIDVTPASGCSGDASEDLDDENGEAPEDSSNEEDTDDTEAGSKIRQQSAPPAGGRKGGPEERLQEPDSFSRVRDLGRDEEEIRRQFPDWPGNAAAIEVIVNEGAVSSSTLDAAVFGPDPLARLCQKASFRASLPVFNPVVYPALQWCGDVNLLMMSVDVLDDMSSQLFVMQ